MNTDRLRENILRHIDVSAEEWAYTISLFREKRVRKRQYLLQAGDVAKFEHFVVEGCLRSYFIDPNGFEHIVQFAIEDWWIGDMYSRIAETPATFNIDALEDSTLLLIRGEDLELLMRNIPAFERYFRVLMQNAFLATQQRILHDISLSAEERYLYFRNKYPLFERRIPQRHIASYLGMTPEFLSRIRKRLSDRPAGRNT